jgi:hypothetical protein
MKTCKLTSAVSKAPGILYERSAYCSVQSFGTFQLRTINETGADFCRAALTSVRALGSDMGFTFQSQCQWLTASILSRLPISTQLDHMLATHVNLTPMPPGLYIQRLAATTACQVHCCQHHRLTQTIRRAKATPNNRYTMSPAKERGHTQATCPALEHVCLRTMPHCCHLDAVNHHRCHPIHIDILRHTSLSGLCGSNCVPATVRRLCVQTIPYCKG